MLFADPLDTMAQSWQMAMVYSREQVMLNLVIQTTTEVVAKEAAIAKILRCNNLMLVKVGTRCMCACFGQVVNLSIAHEALSCVEGDFGENKRATT